MPNIATLGGVVCYFVSTAAHIVVYGTAFVGIGAVLAVARRLP
ncbi:MAG TPA: hypothetical protein VIA18_28275 [Polyangia bacterium]|nr:hypothetical protein [Polyangia bacterium]